MFKKILVPLDGSPLSQRALEPALVVGQQTGAQLLLVRMPVVESLNFSVSEHRHAEARNDALVYLETIRKSNEQPGLHIQTQISEGSEAAARSGVVIKSEVRIGSPAEVILEHVETYDTDLIVMATHGRTGLKRWVYGSVTAKVLRSVNCSMLVTLRAD